MDEDKKNYRCFICWEDIELNKNNSEIVAACQCISEDFKYTHKKCIKMWINQSKGIGLVCRVCGTPFHVKKSFRSFWLIFKENWKIVTFFLGLILMVQSLFITYWYYSIDNDKELNNHESRFDGEWNSENEYTDILIKNLMSHEDNNFISISELLSYNEEITVFKFLVQLFSYVIFVISILIWVIVLIGKSNFYEYTIDEKYEYKKMVEDLIRNNYDNVKNDNSNCNDHLLSHHLTIDNSKMVSHDNSCCCSCSSNQKSGINEINNIKRNSSSSGNFINNKKTEYYNGNLNNEEIIPIIIESLDYPKRNVEQKSIFYPYETLLNNQNQSYYQNNCQTLNQYQNLKQNHNQNQDLYQNTNYYQNQNQNQNQSHNQKQSQTQNQNNNQNQNQYQDKNQDCIININSFTSNQFPISTLSSSSPSPSPSSSSSPTPSHQRQNTLYLTSNNYSNSNFYPNQISNQIPPHTSSTCHYQYSFPSGIKIVNTHTPAKSTLTNVSTTPDNLTSFTFPYQFDSSNFYSTLCTATSDSSTHSL